MKDLLNILFDFVPTILLIILLVCVKSAFVNNQSVSRKKIIGLSVCGILLKFCSLLYFVLATHLMSIVSLIWGVFTLCLSACIFDLFIKSLKKTQVIIKAVNISIIWGCTGIFYYFMGLKSYFRLFMHMVDIYFLIVLFIILLIYSIYLKKKLKALKQ